MDKLELHRCACGSCGGSVLSALCRSLVQADDIEHGILRSNAIAPASIGALLKLPFLARPQFKKGDPRREYVVSPVDPRIHFALVCGAKSCPPIKLYTPDNLDEGLQV